MRIRFISDIHYYLNLETEPTEFTDIMSKKEPADITLIAGDMSACLDEAKTFLEKYFKDEKVVFVNGNHCVYNREGLTLEEINNSYTALFKDQWKFLENGFVNLGNHVYVIGAIGWTDFLIHYETRSHYIKRINARKHYIETHPKIFFDGKWQEVTYTDFLPEDPGKYYDEKFRNKEKTRQYAFYSAQNGMNDFRFGKMKIRNKTRMMTPVDTYKMHKQTLHFIRKAYDKIISKDKDAIIILMTHHPFTKKCISERYRNSELNPAFVSDHDSWLKKFKNIKYIHCGHVHQRFFKKLGDKQVICNPMGYLYHMEHQMDEPFNINYILDIKG